MAGVAVDTPPGLSGAYFYSVGMGFASGIFARSFLDTGFAGAILALSLGVALFLGSKVLGERRKFLPVLVLFSVSLALGMLRLEFAEGEPSAVGGYEGERVEIVGRIGREPEVRESALHLFVKPEGTDEYVLVTTDRFAGESFQYGDTVSVSGVLKKPDAFSADGGRMFDYPGYLRTRGVRTVLPFADVFLVSRDEQSFLGTLYRGKQSFTASIERVLPEPASGLGEGVLLGVKRALGEDLERTFRETGIIHIIVLSGYNVMIVVSTILYLLAFFFFPRTRMLIGIGIILLFALLVGPSATVVRASVMAVLLLVAQATGRTYAVLRGLLLAGTLMLLANPHLLVHDPGFQLSFLATLGLILLSPYIEKRLAKIPETLGVRRFVTATLATQIFVLPLLLYHTGLFSVVSVVVNVLVLPAVPVAMLLTFLTGTVGLVSYPLAVLVGFFAHLSLSYIVVVALIFGGLPFASFSVDAFPFWVAVLAYTLIALATWHLLRRDTEMGTGVTENDYEGWVIEEEKETSPEALRASGDGKNVLPFR